MFKKLFGVKKVELNAPVTGKMIELSTVSDQVFASKMMGEGVAFVLEEDIVSAPCAGEIVLLADTLHAVGLRTSHGAEILIHIGLDTVELNGKGFKKLISVGDKVKAGTPMIQIDRERMAIQKIDLTTPMIITNGQDHPISIEDNYGTVVAGQTVVATVA